MHHRTSSILMTILVVAIISGVTNAAQAKDKGPHIILKYPEWVRTHSIPTIRTTTSARFEMRFEPREAAVDMYSLAVWARKGIFKRSLTDWLKPYIRGNTIVADEVKLPRGEFVLEIQIADRGGEQTSQKLRVIVQ